MTAGGYGGERAVQNDAFNCPGLRAAIPPALILALGLAAAGPAAAQVVIPAPAEPGRAEQSLRERPVTPEAVLPVEAPPPDAAAPPPGADEVPFILSDVRIQGSTVLDELDLRPLYADLLGREVTLATVYRIADEATALYRNRGYILSQVYVPPQQVADGVVTLQVVEGYVEDVVIEGETGGRGLVERMVRKITHSRPLHIDVLEHYLLLAGDLAGVDVRGVLSPSETTQGAATLTVIVDYDRFEGSAFLDNLGSEFVGPWTFGGGMTANSLFGAHERLGFRFKTATQTNELAYAELFADVPIGTEGTTLYGQAAFSESEPGGGLQQFNLVNNSFYGKIGVRHPVIRTRRASLFLDAGFEWADLESDTETFGLISEDKLRVVRLAALGDVSDTLFGLPSVTTYFMQVSFGLDAFDATSKSSPLSSRPGADAQFASVRADIRRYQGLGANGLTLLMAARGQYTDEPLLASEEIAFGGTDYLRGYDPSAVSGDRGLAGTLELQYQRALQEALLFDRYQLYGFYDAGVVEDIDYGAPGVTRSETLQSAGAGVRLAARNNLEMDIGLGYKLNEVDPGGADPDTIDSDKLRVLFRINAGF